MSYRDKRPNVFYPFLFAVVLAAGMYIGTKMVDTGDRTFPFQISIRSGANKLERIVEMIRTKYVDSVNAEIILESGINGILKELDPHSIYIPARDFIALNEPLDGNFEGIGIEFNIISDTIVVIAPITGGPSEALGIKTGDRIIKIEEQIVAGTGISTIDVIRKLRGKKDTEVTITIKRGSIYKPLIFTIIRDEIPINSVDIAYLPEDNTGFIKINRFANTTTEEFRKAIKSLKDGHVENLILDLRGNPGGYLNSAIELADEFLPNGKLIVYTEGNEHIKNEYIATGAGSFEKGKLIILIDEGSASASEIVAGAVQDWDRGIIIGRRSFGKGLVGEQTQFSDGSALRLTVARYFTPSGRCIQKPYQLDKTKYHSEVMNRFLSGEITNKDSVKINDSLKYITSNGKIVYGGGGIMPDIFVPVDTNASEYLNYLFFSGLIHEFVFKYVDRYRQNLLASYPDHNLFINEYIISDESFNELLDFAEKNEIKKKWPQIWKTQDRIKAHLKALVARQLYGNAAYYPLFHKIDNIFQRTLLEIQSKEQN